jgi:hypothetical protein
MAYILCWIIRRVLQQSENYNGISARHADNGSNVQFILQMTDMVTNPLLDQKKLETLKRTIAQKYGQTREEHTAKL